MLMTTAVTPDITRFGTLERMITAAPSRAELNARPEYRDLLFAELDRRLDRPGRILSLDIFDTLLLRDGSSELRRFWEIGVEMARVAHETAGITIRAADAFLLRYLGTRATYRASPSVDGCREGCLSEIHRTASRMIPGIGAAAADALHAAFIEAELAYEASRLAPATALIDYLARHRQRGGACILITDMYMRESYVRALFTRLDIAPGLFETIFSSADHKVSKASGGIFSIAAKAMDRPSEAFVHVGDSLNGDFRLPRRHGWEALHLPIADEERRCRRLDHFAIRDEIMAKHGFAVDVAPPA